MSTHPQQLSIQPEAQIYGYLVGLSLERGDLHYSPDNPGKMYARFEYQEQTITYLVPDWELFTALSIHLCDNARTRALSGNYQSEKIAIQKLPTGWSVYTP